MVILTLAFSSQSGSRQAPSQYSSKSGTQPKYFPAKNFNTFGLRSRQVADNELSIDAGWCNEYYYAASGPNPTWLAKCKAKMAKILELRCFGGTLLFREVGFLLKSRVPLALLISSEPILVNTLADILTYDVLAPLELQERCSKHWNALLPSGCRGDRRFAYFYLIY